MAHYDLSHLTQPDSQRVMGPIQDDEALFLFSIIRGMRLKTILEIGGGDGYSARNFLRAVGLAGSVITIDVNHVSKLAENHKIIRKNIADINKDDFFGLEINLVFFDCHDYDAQMKAFFILREFGSIADNTIIAIHDTGTHPTSLRPSDYRTLQGYVHQKAERLMVNEFVRLGYSAFCLHTKLDMHDESFPFRHGITVLQRFENLVT